MHVLNFKNNDHITDDVEFIPLISDINDAEGVLIEHQELNKKSNKLEFALIEHRGNYYFIDCKTSIKEDVYVTDGKNFICPNCRQKLALISGFTRNGKKVDSYLRHTIDETECVFKSRYNSDWNDKSSKKFSSEGSTHKQLKLSTLRNIINGGIRLNIPSDYSIIMVENSPLVLFKYKEILLNDEELEKTVLKRDEETKGYRPDITSYTNDMETIYIEVTDRSGKRVSEYYDIWKRLNKTVIEVRKTENLTTNAHEGFFFTNDGFEIYETCSTVAEEKTFRLLYNPIVETARQEKNNILMRIADKKRKTERKERFAKFINNVLDEINKTALESKIEKMPVKEIKFQNGGCLYIGFNDFEYPSYWYKVCFKDVFVYRKLPPKIYKALKERCEFLTIVKN